MLISRIKAFTYSVVLLLGTASASPASSSGSDSLYESFNSIALTRYERESVRTLATIQKGKITDPGVAAQRLYGAWKKNSKKAALKVASTEAVSKLFSTKWRPMKFKGCQNTGGSFECIYHDAKNDFDLAMVIEGGMSAGYHVESLSFSSEAASLPAERNKRLSLA